MSMTTAQYVDYVESDLTGGGFISLQVKRTNIEGYVIDALERVRPYYKEIPIFATVPVVIVDGQSGYIEVSELSKPIHSIEALLPVEEHHAGDYVLEEISDLLGLPAGLWDSGSVRNYAEWMQARRAIRKSMGKEMGYRYIKGLGKIYVDDVAWNKNRVTVVYSPFPEHPEDVTFGKAIAWIKDWTLAKTKVTWGGVLGKFPDVAVMTNAATLRSEGKEEMKTLEDRLSDLYFSYGTFSRKS